jgi:uncharacterized protein (DUF302 family)
MGSSSGRAIALEVPRKEAFRVNTVSAGQTYVIEERFDRALKLIRNALEKRELSVAGEFDVSESFAADSGKELNPSKLLLVDCPLLLFEALALDRAAGVFLPLHVLVSADGHQTQAVCVEPAALFEVRLPVGAAKPLEKLRSRVAMALESVAAQSESHHHPQAGEV